jgi:hypothetical protein
MDNQNNNETIVATCSCSQQEDHFRRWVDWVVVVLAILFACTFYGTGLYLLFIDRVPWMVKLMEEQFAAVVLPPLALTSAVFVVSVLKAASGEVKIEIFKLKFEGNSAPVIMFMLVYSVMISSVAMLWK